MPDTPQPDAPPKGEGQVASAIIATGWTARVIGALLGGANNGAGTKVVQLFAIGAVLWLGNVVIQSWNTTHAALVRSSETAVEHCQDRAEEAVRKATSGRAESERRMMEFYAAEAEKTRINQLAGERMLLDGFAAEREKDRQLVLRLAAGKVFPPPMDDAGAAIMAGAGG